MVGGVQAVAWADVKQMVLIVFALVSMVILPVLPNRTFGPYQVLNPRQIWLMVVLIVGISLGGYVAYKLVGERAGSIVGGIFGGLISSTATTVSYARRSAHAAFHKYKKFLYLAFLLKPPLILAPERP